MEEKPIKLEMSKMLGSVLFRLLVHEIDNQHCWIDEENTRFGEDKARTKTRQNIIVECEELIAQLKKQGIPRPF